MHRRWRHVGLAAVLLGGMMADAAVAQTGDGEACRETCLGQELIRRLPKNEERKERIALLPFGPPKTAIPDGVAAHLYDRIFRAMYDESKGKYNLDARDRREDIWESWQSENEKSDFHEFLKTRGVNIVVSCEDRKLKNQKLEDQLEDHGIALSCVAAPVRRNSKLESDVPGPLAVFPVDARFRYEYTLARLGLELAKEAAEPNPISRVFFADAGTGQRTKLTEAIGWEIRRVAEKRLEGRRRSLPTAITGGSDGGAVAPRGSYELRGEVTRTTETVFVSATLRDGGGEVARNKATIRKEWLPAHLTEQDSGTRRYRASARAAVSSTLGQNSAKRAVRNLARARVVAEALGLEVPGIDQIRSEAEGVEMLRLTLEHGIPADEQFMGRGGTRMGGWKGELDARVVKVGTDSRPELEARLEKDALRAGEEIRIKLSAKEMVYVAMFAWGADNKVIRLYPHFIEPDPTIPKDGHVTLPRDRRCPVTSAPLRGSTVSHEAIIVLAAGKRLDFEKLAPPFCYDPRKETGKPAAPDSVFLDALAKLDLTRAAVTVLPYRVARGE